MANDLNMGMKCIKYMLLTVDVMFLLTATLIISIGATIFAIFTDFSFFIHDGYYSPVNLLIAIGFIMLCVSIFGCVGAIKESTMLINVFAFLLSLVFILEIAAAITAYSLQSGLYDLIEDNLKRGINSYNTSSDAMESVDFLQSRLGCCGIESPNDWDSKYTSNQTLSLGEVAVPDSCCGRYSNNLPSIDSCNSQISYRKGCMKQLVSLIGQSTVLLGTGAMTIAFIQFLGIIFAVVLGKAIRQAKTDRERRRWEIREQIVNNYTQMEPHQGKKMPENPTPVIYVPPIGHSTS